MLKSKPTEANKKAIARWEATNRMTIEIFKAFWQKVSPDLEFPGMQAGEEASYVEWQDSDGDKFQGMRKAGAAKHGIVRSISKYGSIREATWYEDKLHGLSFWWPNDYHPIAFIARIYDHGEEKA